MARTCRSFERINHAHQYIDTFKKMFGRVYEHKTLEQCVRATDPSWIHVWINFEDMDGLPDIVLCNGYFSMALRDVFGEQSPCTLGLQV